MLLGELDLNAGPAVGALAKVDTKFAGTMSGLQKIGRATAGFITFAAILNGLKGALDLGGQLNDLSVATGETSGDLLILRTAFDNAGLGAEATGDFLLRLQDSIAGVNEEGASTAGALKQLGTSAAELRNLPAIDQIDLLQQGLAKLDQTAKVQVSKDLFGKSGAKGLALLSDSGALVQAKEQAGPLAQLMERTSGATDKLGDTLNGLKLNKMELFGGILDSVSQSSTQIADTLGRINFIAVGQDIGKMIDPILGVANALIKAGQGLSNFADTVAQSLLGDKAPAISEFVGDKTLAKRRGLSEVGEAFSGQQFSSLHRLGGGFAGAGGGDPLLNESRAQTQAIRAMHETLKARMIPTHMPSNQVPV